MLESMKMGTKVMAGFGGALGLLLAVGGVAWFGTSTLAAATRDLADVKLPSALVLEQMQTDLYRASHGLTSSLLRRNDARTRSEATAAARKALTAMDDAIRSYEALPHGEAALGKWAELKRSESAWKDQATRAIAGVEAVDRLLEAGKDRASAEVTEAEDAAWKAYEAARASLPSCEKLLDGLGELTRQDADFAQERGESAASRAMFWIAVGILVGALLLLASGTFLARSIRRTVEALVAQAGRLREAVAAGHLGERGDEAAVGLEFRPIIAGMNETMGAVERPTRMVVEYAGRIGRGEIPSRITDRFEGDFDSIKSSLNGCIDAVNALVADTAMLAKAGVEGRLATRADAARHQGDFRKVVQGVNETLDAVVGPLEDATSYLDQISKGAIPEKITASYAGDFNGIKESVNRCIDAVNRLVADATMLAEAGVAGRLATRADASRHEGDFRKVVQGVNATLDAVIAPLNVAARYLDEISKGAVPPRITDTYAGDFNAIKESLNVCIEAINLLVKDAGTLGDAALSGQLATRVDASRHQGDFRKVVEGVNQTLDAVLQPVNEAASVLERLAQRDLRARMTGSYQGDHARIKESLNATGQALHDALEQVAAAVDQVSSASQQIAASSQAVASGASEQASSLEETSTSLESVLAITRQATDHAQQANALAQAARRAATEGAGAVNQLQGAMGKIKASAEGTSQIIKDINEIAFQTNLLALNAAVESARAGEAGRGFAVVAEEVRSLALRAKEAATKTEELIQQSVRQAAEGEVSSRHVAEQLGEIVTGIGKVTDIVSEIAAAAKDQTSGIGQVNEAVAEMDKVTQQNAASAEESSSAASELNGQAEELAAMVGSFQLARRSLGAGVHAQTRLAAHGGSPERQSAARPAVRAPTATKSSRSGERVDPFPMDTCAEVRDF